MATAGGLVIGNWFMVYLDTENILSIVFDSDHTPRPNRLP